MSVVLRLLELAHIDFGPVYDRVKDQPEHTPGTELGARTVVPHMIERGGGKIVAVGAFAAQKGVASMGAYVASKAGVVRLVEAMSAELRQLHINVDCVLPTIIDTPDNRLAMPDAEPGRWVAPEALATSSRSSRPTRRARSTGRRCR